ncbi:MAG: rhodanese-related sulfurtransferase [Candidatus Babeliales bacterium]
MNKIILFYKYIEIKNPEALRDWQRELCEKLGLKGRILIAHEGINGTVGGALEAADQYVAIMKAHELFADVDYKESMANADCFPKLKVKVRPEVVRLGIDPRELTPEHGGKHLTPEQTHELIAQKPEDLVILDARNAFEAKIGKFENAIVPDIETFREFPEYVEKNLDLFKDKQVLMYCTGGIRCERASALLKLKNVAKEVYQIEGGIHRYVEKFPDGFFRGKNYVFDGRIAMKVNNDVLSHCELCNEPCDEYTNCINAFCNKQFTACAPCLEKSGNTCSTDCQERVAQQEVVVRTLPAKTSCEVGK